MALRMCSVLSPSCQLIVQKVSKILGVGVSVVLEGIRCFSRVDQISGGVRLEMSGYSKKL